MPPPEKSLGGPGGVDYKFEAVSIKLVSGNATWLELPASRSIQPYQWVQLNATGVSFSAVSQGDLYLRIAGTGKLWIDDFEVRYAG